MILAILFSFAAFPVPAFADPINSEVVGASIRTAGKQGLRFVGKVEKNAALHPGTGANFGFLLLPRSMATSTTQIDELSGNPVVTVDNITSATTSAKRVPAVNLLSQADLETVGIDAADYADFYYFSAVITGIPGEFYATDILARVYVTINEEDQYSVQESRSVQYVANAINEMGGEVPAFVTEALETAAAVGYDILVNADLFWQEVVIPDPGNDPGNDPGEDPGEDPLSSAPYQYVAILGVDGAGRFFQQANTPNIDSIFANGAKTYGCLDPVSISAQSWGSMLHGVTANYHKLTNSVIEDSSYHYPADSSYPSVFRVIDEADTNAKLASIVNWNPINTGIVEEGLGENMTKQTTSSDAGVCTLVCNYLDEQIPTLLFVQFDSVDAAGHSNGWGNSGFLNAITTVDGYIGQIFAKYQAAGVLDETLFIVTADHGGSGSGHGGSDDNNVLSMFAARGNTVVNGGAIGDMENRDVAAIVTYALGLENPAGWTARVPSGLFEGVTAQDRPIPMNNNQSSERYHVTTSPASALDSSLASKLYLWLPLDGDVTNGQSKTTTQHDILYFSDNGYYDGCVAFDDGYVSVSNYNPGTSDFSVSFWINTFGTTADPAILSNKNWASGANQGWILALQGSNIKFNVGNGSSRRDVTFNLPSDYSDGWMHVILTVNHSANEIKLYYDFVEASGTVGNNQNMNISGVSFTNGSTLNIGQDGTGVYSAHLPAFLDDVMIFNGALTASEVAALQTYYGK